MDAMSKTLNEMVHAIVDYCGTITRAADEIGVHYNTLDRLLKDETATAQAGTMEKIEAIYEEIASVEEEEPEEELEKKIEKLEVGKTYEIRIPKSKNGNVVTLLRGTVKGEYRQFYHLDDNGKNITVLKADLVNDRTIVRELDAPAKEVEEPVDVEYVPVVDDEPTGGVVEDPVLSGFELYEMLEAKKKTKKKAKKEIIEEEPAEEVAEEPDETTMMIEELMEEPVEEEEGIPTIIGTTPAERLHSCLFLVELCDQKIAEAEKAKKDRAAILPLMDEIYKEFRA